MHGSPVGKTRTITNAVAFMSFPILLRLDSLQTTLLGGFCGQIKHNNRLPANRFLDISRLLVSMCSKLGAQNVNRSMPKPFPQSVTRSSCGIKFTAPSAFAHYPPAGWQPETSSAVAERCKQRARPGCWSFYVGPPFFTGLIVPSFGLFGFGKGQSVSFPVHFSPHWPWEYPVGSGYGRSGNPSSSSVWLF